ncbi:DUF3052 domain-containing protein [Streptomyces sp. NPDC051567]|uniref:DUF3052 domain-containing protein n=1 Tax=Streptomyces sp. NPDC051567 TaxID=3365660 RepID=UPI0037B214F1
MSASAVQQLGIVAGQVVQEAGYDDDCDEELREAIAETTGNELVDADYEDTADVALLWWRDGDGDLLDALIDVLPGLQHGGGVALLTPKAGRAGSVEAGDIADAAKASGLTVTASLSASPDWTATRLESAASR